MAQAQVPMASPGPVLRGSPSRITDFKEQLQFGYLTAIAAAAGCVVAEYRIDEGIDVLLTHRSAQHLASEKAARLEVQMKATSSFVGRHTNYVAASMSGGRFNELSVAAPMIPMIVVILSLPSDQALWTLSSHNALAIHHCAYWVNLEGNPEAVQNRKQVRAPKVNVFDDVALCQMMERIGQGGSP